MRVCVCTHVNKQRYTSFCTRTLVSSEEGSVVLSREFYMYRTPEVGKKWQFREIQVKISNKAAARLRVWTLGHNGKPLKAF